MCTAWCRRAACPLIANSGCTRGTPGFVLPTDVLSRVCRGKFLEAIRRAYDDQELDLGGGSAHLQAPKAWRALVDGLFATDWVVYVKPAFDGAPAVLRYLGRYTHREAISNHPARL
jgi:hypothetical protein